MRLASPLPGREDATFVGDAELEAALKETLDALPEPAPQPIDRRRAKAGRPKSEVFGAGPWSQDERRNYVDYALNLMAADPTVSASGASSKAAAEAYPTMERKPTATTVAKWAQMQGRPLATNGHSRQRVAAQRRQFYDRQRREAQRSELLELIDMEIERTRKAITKSVKGIGRIGRRRNGVDDVAEAGDDMIAVNFAQRIQALANAHGTISSHSRSDELHGVRMGDVDPGSPAGNLDDWDGDPTRLPTDIEERIVDIEASRRRAQTLSGSA